jgi:hypothetical protein
MGLIEERKVADIERERPMRYKEAGKHVLR